MERGEIHALVTQIMGQADTLEVRVESPFGHGVVGQRGENFLWDFFAACEVDDLYISVINRAAEQQNLEIWRLTVAVYAAFHEVDIGIGFQVQR